jgi:hypothetical protein
MFKKLAICTGLLFSIISTDQSRASVVIKLLPDKQVAVQAIAAPYTTLLRLAAPLPLKLPESMVHHATLGNNGIRTKMTDLRSMYENMGILFMLSIPKQHPLKSSLVDKFYRGYESFERRQDMSSKPVNCEAVVLVPEPDDQLSDFLITTRRNFGFSLAADGGVVVKLLDINPNVPMLTEFRGGQLYSSKVVGEADILLHQ